MEILKGFSIFPWAVLKPSNMKKILIALDYDPSAEKIAETSYALAKSAGAKVLIVHVMAELANYIPLDYSPVMGFTGFPPVDMLQPVEFEELRKGAQQFLESTREHLGDPSIEVRVLDGDFADAILETAKEESVDLIAIGTHSRSAFEKILTGSVTKKLIHDSDIPLYLVPTRIRKEE